MNDQLQNLLAWAQDKHNCHIPSNVKFLYDDIKGITCIYKGDGEEAENKDEDEILCEITIPYEMILTADKAVKYFHSRCLKSFLTEKNSNINDNSLLKFYIAKLKFGTNLIKCSDEGEEQFIPYIDALPLNLNCPLIWNPLELSLLFSTNLRQSWKSNITNVYNEWKNVISWYNRSFNSNENIEYDIETSSMEDIYLKYTFKLNPSSSSFSSSSNSIITWTSFEAFLWAHLIATSRAFPEYVINKNTDNNITGNKSNIMFLPVIDLLNHDYNAKVEWFPVKPATATHPITANGFGLRVFCKHIEGCEIFNNYGPKSNEELLNGYGFVLENNINDTVALRLHVPLSTEELHRLLNFGVQLPVLEDYTTYAFDVRGNDTNSRQNGMDNDTRVQILVKEGSLFLINHDLPISYLKNMIRVFGSISSERPPNVLITMLEGCYLLRTALKMKLKKITASKHEQTPISNEEEDYKLNPYRKYCATVYYKSQIKLLKQAIKKVNKYYEILLKRNDPHVVTIQKLLTSEDFLKYLSYFKSKIKNQEMRNDEIMEQINEEYLFCLWINKTHLADKIEQEVCDQYSESASKIWREVEQNEIPLEEFTKAFAFFQSSSYENNNESILVLPLEI
ncbi:protein-lysine N-methyltransferase SCDLUD_001108 [Saccharomycodes ludwigii]|uniref:protein-lysine N-methyltransferase n=1 Tax=Saccharomycodes ludwigii TaxID=36035 RepID=UPI001E853DF9|nr:hypothetical protein SCDLUD_001108 [Saccharomycodes ludwigii]KAH3903468.1 hypothetical protein SCDLUD_001108 [Saccharomycodes ludwigii]